MNVMVSTDAQRADSLRAVLDSVFADPRYQWTEVARVDGPLARAWRALGARLIQLQQDNPAAFRALFWVLVFGLALILLHAGWVALTTIRGAAARSDAPVESAGPVREAAWYARESARLAGAGRFVEAMQVDFVRLMLELDARQVVRFHPSKTPAEFAHEATGPAREPLRELVASLYRYAFARERCGREEYDAWTARAQSNRYASAN